MAQRLKVLAPSLWVAEESHEEQIPPSSTTARSMVIQRCSKHNSSNKNTYCINIIIKDTRSNTKGYIGHYRLRRWCYLQWDEVCFINCPNLDNNHRCIRNIRRFDHDFIAVITVSERWIHIHNNIDVDCVGESQAQIDESATNAQT